jgi:hypothetical protein
MEQVLQANDCCQLPTKSPSKLHTVHYIMVADDVHLLFFTLNKVKLHFHIYFAIPTPGQGYLSIKIL